MDVVRLLGRIAASIVVAWVMLYFWILVLAPFGVHDWDFLHGPWVGFAYLVNFVLAMLMLADVPPFKRKPLAPEQGGLTTDGTDRDP